MPRFTEFSEKSFLKKKKKIWYMGKEESEILGSDAIVLKFSKELDFTDYFIRVFERLDF